MHIADCETASSSPTIPATPGATGNTYWWSRAAALLLVTGRVPRLAKWAGQCRRCCGTRRKGGSGAVGWVRRPAMSLVILPGVAGALVVVAAAAGLWRGSFRHEPPVRNAYRWFAVAALLWGAGFVAQEATAASGGGTSLTFADLLSLLALPAIGIGLAGMAGRSRAAGGDRAAPRAQARGAVAWLADACLIATALFIIAWLAVFGSEYHKLGESPGVFTTQAVHPIADILALGVLLA